MQKKKHDISFALTRAFHSKCTQCPTQYLNFHETVDIVFFNLNKRVDLFYPSQTSLMFQTAAGGVYGLTAARSATIPVDLVIDYGSDAVHQSQR